MKKIFCVIAYDIKNNKRRTKITKQIQKYGARANLSVFECMLTIAQLSMLQEELVTLVRKGEDRILIYPMCLACVDRVIYIPSEKRTCKVVVLA